MFSNDRASSAMSDMSINVGGLDGGSTVSRPPSRLEMELGDEVSGMIVTSSGQQTNTDSSGTFDDDELNLDNDLEIKQKEEDEVKKRAEEQQAIIQLEAQNRYEENEKIRIEKEKAEQKA